MFQKVHGGLYVVYNEENDGFVGISSHNLIFSLLKKNAGKKSWVLNINVFLAKKLLWEYKNSYDANFGGSNTF